MAHSQAVQQAADRATVWRFASAVLALYALVWGAELAFPRSLVSALALVAATALGAWVVRPGWNVRPRQFSGRWLALFGLLLASAGIAAWFLASLDVPIPYDVSADAILRAVPAIIVVTGIEELLFRQVMYRWLEQRRSSTRSIVIATALAFAGAHLGPILTGSPVGATFHLLQSAYMVWIGVLLGQIRSSTNSWLMSWLGHFAYNVAILHFLSLAARSSGG